MVPTVKYAGGKVLIWGCMSAEGVGELYFIDGIINFVDLLQKPEIEDATLSPHHGWSGTFSTL